MIRSLKLAGYAAQLIVGFVALTVCASLSSLSTNHTILVLAIAVGAFGVINTINALTAEVPA